MKEGYCKNCGKYFRRNRGSRDASLFCSRECNYAYQTRAAQARRELKEAAKEREEAAKVRFVVCSVCGKEFSTKNKTRQYCSKDCCLEAGRIRSRERSHRLYPVNFKPQKVLCRWCGKEFETEYKKSKVFCSDECRDAKAKHEDKMRMKRRGYYRSRRFRGKVIDKDICLEKLIVRDKGKCKLCGGVVNANDFTIVNGHMKCGASYPTIDHIIPLSQGGLHSWANVQLAHFLCNSYKGGDFLVREDICNG